MSSTTDAGRAAESALPAWSLSCRSHELWRSGRIHEQYDTYRCSAACPGVFGWSSSADALLSRTLGLPVIGFIWYLLVIGLVAGLIARVIGRSDHQAT